MAVAEHDQRSASKPVLMWAAFGAVFSGVAIVGWCRWLASPYLRPSPTGSDGFGGWHEVYLRCFEIATFALSLFVVYRFLVRPLVRERRLDFDGMFIIGSFVTWFYDPLPNIDVWTFAYNSHFVNLGSWTHFIPFWHSPGENRIPEPLLFIGGAYLAWFFFIPMLLGERFLVWVQRRFARLSTLGAFATLWVLLAVIESVFFFAMTVPGLIQFPGAVRSLTIGAGHPWQYPVYDAILAPFLFCGIASLRYFRDDRGRSFVERGVDQIPGPRFVRKGASLLAITGAFQCLLIFGYLVPYQEFAIRTNVTPPVKSYIRGDVCGTGTPYACPGEDVPIPSKHSLHISPSDPRLPTSVRDAQHS